mmetsp:Transcript_115058/g.330559  ORF Transcript_115058/g.330559 Transcript_115058/m.330559 type:complete len:215 (+) Transcript_115058:473-1117(+)
MYSGLPNECCRLLAAAATRRNETLCSKSFLPVICFRCQLLAHCAVWQPPSMTANLRAVCCNSPKKRLSSEALRPHRQGSRCVSFSRWSSPRRRDCTPETSCIIVRGSSLGHTLWRRPAPMGPASWRLPLLWSAKSCNHCTSMSSPPLPSAACWRARPATAATTPRANVASFWALAPRNSSCVVSWGTVSWRGSGPRLCGRRLRHPLARRRPPWL